MATTRQKLPPGSAPWIASEIQNAHEAIATEVEDFGYSVRNELEWLNEHMADIFSGEQLNITDVFKTPGKLRGKTPRTARKRNPLGERAPLTDIFAPNSNSRSVSPVKSPFHGQLMGMRSSQDQENSVVKLASAQQAQQRFKYNTDSGYHGMTDDEMDLDVIAVNPSTAMIHEDADSDATQPMEERRQTGETYLSAKESIGSIAGKATSDPLRSIINPIDGIQDVIMIDAQDESHLPRTDNDVKRSIEGSRPSLGRTTKSVHQIAGDGLPDNDQISDQFSPAQPLVRKSSLNFASLPGREPLTAKKSFGMHQAQRTSFAEQIRSTFGGGNLGRFTGGKSLGGGGGVDLEVTEAEDQDQPPPLNRQESETTRLHNKTSTQKLHERITLLGKAREVRPSKSIPSGLATQQPDTQTAIEDAPSVVNRDTYITQPATRDTEFGDDDWIAPLKPTNEARPGLEKSDSSSSIKSVQSQTDQTHVNNSLASAQVPQTMASSFKHSPKKHASSSNLASPTKLSMAPEHPNGKAVSVSNPNPPASIMTYTPVGSPAKKAPGEGALSASKSKLYSVLRSAKNIFASSAGASAQAKMEVLSSAPASRPTSVQDRPSSPSSAMTEVPVLYPTLSTIVEPAEEGRRTRGSTDREQKRKAEEDRQREKIAVELEKVREKERAKAAAHAAKATISRPASPAKSIRTDANSIREAQQDEEKALPPPPPPKSLLPQTSSQRLREPRRIGKPAAKEVTKITIKPAPMHVRMPSQRAAQVQAPSIAETVADADADSDPPPPPPKSVGASRPPLTTAASSGSLRTASSSQAAKKALDAAAKKKEQEAKAAQRKADQRRELELKRQARIEEERKAEDERKAEESRKLEEQRRLKEKARLAESKKPAPAKTGTIRRLEQQQQQRDAARPPSRSGPPTDLASVLQQDRSQAQSNHNRSDLPGARPLARMPLLTEQSRPPIQINPAKPPKRALQVEAEEEQPQRPATQRNPASYQQLNAKRRKTEDEFLDSADQRRSVMAAPPVRQSIIRKDNKYPYSHHPGAASTQHGQPSSIFVKTVTTQHQLAHQAAKPSSQRDMSVYASHRIPFAEAPNPPAGPSQSGQSQYSQFKTPGKPASAIQRPVPPTAAKSSPHFPPSESIALPEILTDSEDEDSENEFEAPEWVNSPALRELLTQQQLVDPLSVFGPIAPLHMEEVFKGSKKEKKFRDRTSSALWVNDRVTEEERRKDREAREKMNREGGWSFNPDH